MPKKSRKARKRKYKQWRAYRIRIIGPRGGVYTHRVFGTSSEYAENRAQVGLRKGYRVQRRKRKRTYKKRRMLG